MRVVRPAASVRRRPHRPCTATPCWRRCVPSRFPSRSSSCAAVCKRCARPSTHRTPRPRPPGSRRSLGDALLAMADELVPVVRLADWKDRASAAQTAGKDYRLRELRAVVAASRTVNLDDEGRATAKALQESLDQRTTALREEWLARITNALNDGRVQQAVEASIRPPEPGTRCPAELAVRLAGAAGEALYGREGTRGVDAAARRRRRVTGAPQREAGGDPRRRGGPSGRSPRGRRGAGAGQALGSPHPPSPAAPRSTPSAASAQPAAERQEAGREAGRLEALLGRAVAGKRQGVDLGTPGLPRTRTTAASMSAVPTPTPRAAAST